MASLPSVSVSWPMSCLCVVLLLVAWLDQTWAMRPDRIATLRHETVEMFYHGFDNYMRVAFPDDEVCSQQRGRVWSRDSALTS